MYFRLRFKQLGSHTHIRVFSGNSEGSLGLCGSLAMRNKEWVEFRDLLKMGEREGPLNLTVDVVEDHDNMAP